MKKLISLLAVIALVAVLATVAFAAEDPALVIEDVTAAPGEEVVLNIEIVNNPGITLGEFVFEFDTTALEFVSATAVGGDGWDWLIMINDNTENAKFGSVVFSASDGALTGDCTLVTLTLKVKGDVKPGKYPVSAVVDFIGDDYEDLIVGTTFTGYVEIPCTDHVWAEEGTVKTAATCTEPGVMEYKCIYCDATKEEAIPAEGHTWGEWEVTTPAACGVEGVETRTCSVCNETETRAVAALEHAWGEWTVTKEATCGVAGEETRTCANCNETETREIAALEHKWVETERVEASCFEDGKVVYTCENCGETKEEVIEAADAHTWNEGEVKTAATCCTDGVMVYTCTACGETKEEAIAANGEHTWNEGEVKTAATCCTDGVMLYTCVNGTATKEEAIAATGEHDLAYEAIDDVNHKVICKTSGKELSTEAHTFGDWIDDAENPGWKYQLCDKCQYKLLDEISNTGDNSMIAVAVATLSMLGIAVVVSKKKEF